MREVSIRCVLSQQLHNLFPDQPISRAASLNIVQTRYLTRINPFDIFLWVGFTQKQTIYATEINNRTFDANVADILFVEHQIY